MFSRYLWGTLTMLLAPGGLVIAQPADGRPDAYPGGPDMLSWHSDVSRNDRSGGRASYPRGVAGPVLGRPDLEGLPLAYRNPYIRYPFSYQAYATGPANWTPGYSYPYGYSSSWYPYTSWRGLGNEDNAFPNYDYNVYSPIPSVYGAPVEQAYSVSRTYAAPAYAAGGRTSRTYSDNLISNITVAAPAGADIYLEGVKVASGGEAVHTFQTPTLNPTQRYRYRVRAAWTGPDGQKVDQTQDVAFSAGAGVTVRFPTGPTTRSFQTTD